MHLDSESTIFQRYIMANNNVLVGGKFLMPTEESIIHVDDS